MIGKKIKEARLKRNMTQAELAGDFITRNMLSQIENGLANPSLSTLTEIASRLSVPLEYLVSESDDLSFYERKSDSEKIAEAFRRRDFEYCVQALSGASDDDGRLLLAMSLSELGKEQLKKGCLYSAQKSFMQCSDSASKSVYASDLCKSAEKYVNLIDCVLGRDTLRSCEPEEPYYAAEIFGKSTFASRHASVRRFMAQKDFPRARSMLGTLLSEARELGAIYEYYVLSDLELCLKEAGDFEQAYSCAERRRALSEDMNK